MATLMRCPFCGLLQDEPAGVKTCPRCGGGLEYENLPPSSSKPAYVQVQMELDQVAAPAGRNVERYLLLTIRTPDKVPEKEAAPSGKKRPPLNFAPVLDTSGSMHGEKIAHAREAVRQAVHFLHAGDVFSLVTFASEVKCPLKPVNVDEKNIAFHRVIRRGMRIGFMGDFPHGSGKRYHLHFEIRKVNLWQGSAYISAGKREYGICRKPAEWIAERFVAPSEFIKLNRP